jgi:predicted Fe-Mo cluster-binding NifX family protein
MKIGIARDGDMVSAHFGQCEGYIVVTVENGTIVGREEVANPGHAPGVLPRLMADVGADVVIAGGMGPKAVDQFCLHGIEVILGVEGTVESAVERYLSGTLEEGDNVCHH